MRKQPLHPRTAMINQKQKNQSKKGRLDALQWLQMTFPAAFDNRTKIQPLNLGIMQEILAHAEEAAKAGISKSKLREAVVLFTRRLDYLACLKARDLRIDLYGQPTTIVSEEDSECAALKIKKRIEKTVKNMRKQPVLVLESSWRSKLVKPQSEILQSTTYTSSERLSPYTASVAETYPPKVASVTVTHKQARHYDPEAVARLKEKLGLVQKTETCT